MASKPSFYSSDLVPIPSTSTCNPSLVVVLNKDLHRVRRVKLEILVVAIGVVQFQFLCNSTCKVIEGKKCLKVFSRKKKYVRFLRRITLVLHLQKNTLTWRAPMKMMSQKSFED